MKNISVVVLTHNDQEIIDRCLTSVSFADEILIIDDYSTDKTVEKAKTYTSTVYRRHVDNNFSDQRNFALSKAKGPWVFFLDSDEVVTDELAQEITSILSSENGEYIGYVFKRHDIMWGRTLKYGEIGDQQLLRLGLKGKGEFEGKVHEVWKIQGKVGSLTNPILHFPHKTLSEFLSEINIYSTIRAEELYEKKVSASFFEILSYPVGKFVLNYFFRLGFLDKTEGLLVAICMSFHSFLVRSKLWQLYDDKK